jgi:aspartate-semialdehyde dehydrogenase
VIGATGTVGETLVQILEERDFPVGNLHLLASSESAGSSVPFRGKNVRVREVDEFDFSKVKLVFFAAGPAVTLSFAARATAAGCSVIDLSGALPAEQAPQVVPEANAAGVRRPEKAIPDQQPEPVGDDAGGGAGAVAGFARPAARQRHRQPGGFRPGREAVTELARQTAELLNVRPLEPTFFDRQMAFNLLAQVGKPDAQGHTLLEKRLVRELRQVLALPLLKISVTCVQAPVFFGDSFSVTLQSASAVDLAKVNAAWKTHRASSWLKPVITRRRWVTRWAGCGLCWSGTPGVDDPAELNLWLTSDNVRKGAALNAVQLAELLIKDLL